MSADQTTLWMMNPTHAMAVGWVLGVLTGYLAYKVTHYKKEVSSE